MSEFPQHNDQQRQQPNTGAPEHAVPASVRGAVDLGAMPSSAAGTSGAAAPSAGAEHGASYRVNITVQDFQKYAERSATVPVVVALYAPQSPESETFVETLAQLVDSYQGKLLLGTVDASKEQQIAQVFQAQTVPTVVAMVGGQAVPLVNSTVPADQMRQLLDELLTVAAQNGVTGTAEPTAQAAPKQLPPLHQDALDKLEAGDLDGAEASYNKALAENPGDKDAKLALAQVHLLQRVSAMDANAVRHAAADDPQDVRAALDVADLDVSGGHVEDAFRRLLQLVRTTFGDDKDTVRERLVELFDVVGSEDPRVTTARGQLMRALF
ncbi:tetratricopeptide repeat protein [Kocuria sp. cx-455]|uniref:tetratricopeptide repeat protein n=1 Tax=unclassified Candidatus Sulfotelmatobacter TaxID=2635724 RepID=UPI001683DE23|nr:MULTISPECIES: tetratricopeptide repeat protein [unclassified Candidatus Sulfotelmatobacter]MBD2761117.1 tetratricopeptide repeat protein [Kocuria sp. cx-116]MBD2764706.1 tetratricopeptide repeat protein [Kocuria sp. cx-455]